MQALRKMDYKYRRKLQQILYTKIALVHYCIYPLAFKPNVRPKVSFFSIYRGNAHIAIIR
jgi:hypothetical protein